MFDLSLLCRRLLGASLVLGGLSFAGLAEAAVIRVNTLADVVSAFDGLCSLREAIRASNNNVRSGPAAGECIAGAAFPNPDVIRFLMLNGIIMPTAANGPLPALTNGGVTIDGWSAPGGGAGRLPPIGIDGQLLGAVNGLEITSPSNQIRGLAVFNFDLNGIRIDGVNATSNHVYGNIIGADLTGTLALGNDTGVSISSGATQNIIGTNGDGIRDRGERNVISGNLHTGISISGTATEQNRISGNYIGTTVGGTLALGNTINGVQLVLSAANNFIGTDSSGDAFDDAEGNVISGNGQGINQVNANANIAGNLIGLNAAGNAAIPNLVGIQTLDTSVGDRIGTNGDGVSDDFERNVISGNTVVGLSIRGTLHQVAGNYIGTDSTGALAVPNGGGIEADIGPLSLSADITIGGSDERFRNVISGNSGTGINITATRVTVECNFIGTDATGTLPLGNLGIGANVTSGVDATLNQNVFSFNLLGFASSQDTAAVNDNIIADNLDGVSWFGAGVFDLIDNFWGDASGPTHALNPGGVGDTLFESGGGIAAYNPWLVAAPTLCAVGP